MGQIGQTVGGLFGIGQNPGLDTYGASPYGQNYANLVQQQQANLQNVNAAQQNLVGQLGQVAQGNGPNPAQAMLAQQAGKNVQAQAAQQAGQRGASQNVGLIARNAGQQGANIQQQAAGQGATMQAQQQLGAMGQQAGVMGQQGQQASGAIGAYEAAMNSANQINAQTAANAAQFGQGFGGGLLTGVGSMLAKGGEVKMADGGDPFSFGNASGDYTSPTTADPSSGGGGSFIGQFLQGGGGSGGSQTGKQKGKGLVKGILGNLGKGTQSNVASGATSLGSGSMYNQNMTPFGNAMANSPGMAAGNAGFSDMGGGAAAAQGAGSELGGVEAAEAGGGADALAALAAYGGKASKKVDALVSPGEHRVPKETVSAVAKGKVSPLKVGETFPGKPKVKGNSYDNDTLPRKLAAGDVIIPNKIMQSKDPERGAAEFVRDVLRKKGKRS